MKLTMMMAFLCACLCASLLASANTVRINQPLSDKDVRYQYPELLLQLVLDATAQTYGKTKVERAEHVMSRDRTFLELISGDIIDVMAEAPKPEWEEQLIPVRIPIRKGVQGLRLFFVHNDHLQAMAQIRKFDDLLAMPTGSGAQWSTARVMREAGFEVVTSSAYEGLFEMLQRKRFDTFGRGINEIFAEWVQHHDLFPEIVIDPNVLLYIPLPTYFFVTPKRPELAQRIEVGLKRLINDGRFDQFFCRYHRQDIEQARIAQRRTFCIPNPNLSAETPFSKPSYWTSEVCGLNIVPIDYSRVDVEAPGACQFSR